MRVRISMLLGSLAVATAAGVIPLSGVAGAQSPNAGANPNASPCAPGGPAYPPGQGSGSRGTTVSSNNFRRGDGGNVQGCASPNSRFNATLFSHPKPLGSGNADGTGAFSLGFRIPCDTEDGGHTLVVQGSGVVDGSANLTVSGTNTAVCGQSAAVGNIGEAGRQSTVARRAASGGGGALPRTGSASTAPLTAAGIGLVLIGSAAVVVTRRRRSEAASATH